MPRSDTNQIALKAARAVLEAAHPFTFFAAGTEIRVEVSRLPQPSWPRTIEGLEVERDGPWPAPVQVQCLTSSAKLDLLLRVVLNTASTRYKDHVGLNAAASQSNRALLWINLANRLDSASETQPGIAQANSALISKEGDTEVQALTRAMNALARQVGLPFLSPTQVDTFRMTVPDGTIQPDPATGFKRLVQLAIIKYPFMTRGESDAVKLFDIGQVLEATPEPTSAAGAELPASPVTRYTGVQPLPGGARAYFSTLLNIVRWASEEPRSVEDFNQLLHAEYGQSGESAINAYRLFIINLGVLEETSAGLSPTEFGQRLLSQPDPNAFFDQFDERYAGLLEVLVVAGKRGGLLEASATREVLNALLNLQWAKTNQVVYRFNWLACLGLLEQQGTGFRLTGEGRKTLERHSARAQEIGQHLEALPFFVAQPELLEDEDQDDPSEVPPQVELTSGRPPYWDEDALKLTREQLEAELGHLRLPSPLLEQASAALRAGKHLLLTGPPGTGKTELATVIGRAARKAGYCQGLFTATASADWSTFDVLGGYTLQRSRQLEFRSGVFLRALEDYKWLLIDELNRADIDRAFGELMTLLSGGSVDTHFMGKNEVPIGIGRDSSRYSHVMPGAFRVIGTMNTWDKTSLFRLSYAVQRRFAVLHVDVPDDDLYHLLLEEEATREGALRPPLEDSATRKLQALFSSQGLLRHRPVGPAVARDMVRYMRERAGQGDGAAEAVVLFLLPQLEGLHDAPAQGVWAALREMLKGWASDRFLMTLRGYYQELFPHLKLEKL